MGLASCIALSGVSLLGADSDIRGAHGISGLFTPEGLFGGTLGALIGNQSMREGADLGSLATDARNLFSDLRFIESGPPDTANEVLTRFLLGSSDYYILLEDIRSAQKDLPSTDNATTAGEGDNEAAADAAADPPWAAPTSVAPGISSIDPPGSQGSDGSAYGGSDDSDDGWW